MTSLFLVKAVVVGGGGLCVSGGCPVYRESSSFLRRQSSGVLDLAFWVSFSVYEKGVCGVGDLCVFLGMPCE